jgi:hypothetical protein
MREMLTSYPELVKEWHPTKNGDLKPENFTPGSGKKVWWKCSEGDDHEWKIKIDHRSKGSGCPFCSGRKASKSNNFLVLFPDIATEWHPTKNHDLKPENFTSSSGAKVWWKCPKGDDHEWETEVRKRTLYHTKCPFCKNRSVSKTNNLFTKFPLLAREWHPTKNGQLSPDSLVSGCPVGDDHEWQSSCDSRRRGSGCPMCRGLKASDANNVAKKYPNLINLWHPTKNGTLLPTQVPSGTDRKLWWRCPKNSQHEWSQAPYTVTKKGEPCPYCGLRKLGKDNTLQVLYPTIAKEFHAQKNGILMANNCFS